MPSRPHHRFVLLWFLLGAASCSRGNSTSTPLTSGGSGSWSDGSASGGAIATGGAGGGTQASGDASAAGASGGGTASGGSAAGGSGASTSASGGSPAACEAAGTDAGPAPEAELQVGLDPAQTFQTTEGWGTSLCWFGNVLGAWADDKLDHAADLLFDPEDGLGLNVVRYNIGGGDAPGHEHMGFGREMPGVKASASSEFDYSADENQIKVLSEAAERVSPGELIIEGFSNSPPYWMTESGCASGSASGGSNLRSDAYDDFADFLADVTLHFRDVLGLPFRTVEPLNEPLADWWKSQGGQEGCHFSRSEQALIIKQLRASLNERGLAEVEIAASDETSLDDAVATYQSFDAETRAAMAQINTHAYSGSQRAQLRALATGDSKRLWSSEIDGSGASDPFAVFPHAHDDIVPGLDLAQRITRDLREMQVDAFVFWQAVESEQAQVNLDKNWGLLHGDFEGDTQSVALTKKYHVMMQYTRAIRPGDLMIQIEHQDAVAFVNDALGKLVIVQRNAGTSASTRSYDLSGFTSVGARARVTRTSATEDHASLEDVPILQGQLVATIAPQSVTTFVLDCVSR